MSVRDPRFLLNRPLAGWDGKFSLALRPFDGSSVICQEKPANPPFEDGCDTLLQSIPAGVNDWDTFGPAGAPDVTEALPFAYYADCKILSFSKCCHD